MLIPTTLGAVSLVFFAIRLVPGHPLGGYWLYRMWLA
jgi:ABC-type microcin C transport system permease subunit YejB